jgi:solute carrier family 34 (sodium-dependent phosphate cotransporter)
MSTSRERFLSIFRALAFLAALNIFFVAIKLLGAFKDIGSGMGEALMADLASQPILGLLLGILVTSVIQSSSTTTSIIVGLAASGVFGDNPEQAMQAAVPMVMGANIGTTVTNTIVSFGNIDASNEFKRAFAAATIHDIFNFIAVVILLPIQVATNFLGIASLWLTEVVTGLGGMNMTSPLRYIVSPQVSAVERLFEAQVVIDFVIIVALVIIAQLSFGFLSGRQHHEKKGKGPIIGVIVGLSFIALAVKSWHQYLFTQPTAEFVFGLGALLFALWIMITVMRGAVLDRAQRLFDKYFFTTPIRAMVVGLVLTTLVQSSSVTTSLIVPLAGAGLVTLAQIFPYALGANLGTTITAFLAALSLGEPIALAVAVAHLLFNTLGILIVFPIKAIRRIPLIIAEKLAEGAVRWRPLPFVYVLCLYVILPLLLIWLGGEAG